MFVPPFIETHAHNVRVRTRGLQSTHGLLALPAPPPSRPWADSASRPSLPAKKETQKFAEEPAGDHELVLGKYGTILEDLKVGTRVTHKQRGEGIIMRIDHHDKRGKPYILGFESGEVHHYSTSSAAKFLKKSTLEGGRRGEQRKLARKGRMVPVGATTVGDKDEFRVVHSRRGELPMVGRIVPLAISPGSQFENVEAPQLDVETNIAHLQAAIQKEQLRKVMMKEGGKTDKHAMDKHALAVHQAMLARFSLYVSEEEAIVVFCIGLLLPPLWLICFTKRYRKSTQPGNASGRVFAIITTCRILLVCLVAGYVLLTVAIVLQNRYRSTQHPSTFMQDNILEDIRSGITGGVTQDAFKGMEDAYQTAKEKTANLRSGDEAAGGPAKMAAG